MHIFKDHPIRQLFRSKFVINDILAEWYLNTLDRNIPEISVACITGEEW